MASGHPVDDHGRVLPECDWPADRAAPEPWDVIRRFCNTRNHESGADRFATTDGLRRWCDGQGVSSGAPNADDRDRIVRFRELVCAHALEHHDGADEADLHAALEEQLAGIELTLTVRHGLVATVPTATSTANQTIGTVAIAIMDAQRVDAWKRFKACQHCRWVFYDRSKNQSGRWCSMSACGGRAKVAAFRARARSTDR